MVSQMSMLGSWQKTAQKIRMHVAHVEENTNMLSATPIAHTSVSAAGHHLTAAQTKNAQNTKPNLQY